MGRLEGRVAVITAATSGMALATAKLLVEEGAYVFITGRGQEKLNQAVETIGRNVTGVRGDASSLEDLDRLYKIVQKEQGRIDVLFANAGQGEFAKLEEVTVAITLASCDSSFVNGAELFVDGGATQI